MNLIDYEPFKAINRLQSEINQLFRESDFFSPHSNDLDVAGSQWRPSVDLKDEEGRFVISADIPGVDPKDIEVTMEDGVLSIKGERKTETKEEHKGYRRVECSSGTFIRRFSLPETVDADSIEAKGKNGVLNISIAKKEPTQVKKIEINT